jgi:hypothetical protein
MYELKKLLLAATALVALSGSAYAHNFCIQVHNRIGIGEVNLRTGPGDDFSIITKAWDNQIIYADDLPGEMQDTEGVLNADGWTHISVYRAQVGDFWIRNKYVFKVPCSHDFEQLELGYLKRKEAPVANAGPVMAPPPEPVTPAPAPAPPS